MKILQINTVFPQGSTGKICQGIARAIERDGDEAYVAYAHAEREKTPFEMEVTSRFDHHLHNRLARMTMGIGNFSYFHTKRFLKKVKRLSPDVIHLHNLHGNYIHLPSLFRFLKKQGIPVVWTLHDCWSFTGYCMYYDMVGCEKWKTACMDCPMRHNDAVTILDRSRTMFRKKKAMLSGIERLTLVTPSQWLADEVSQSFLQTYPVRVIRNGIDLSVFAPRESTFRRDHGIAEDAFVLLGVALPWDTRKGLDVFLELAACLDDRFAIVLVGTNDALDSTLPSRIVSVHRTQNQEELAAIYTAADLYVNPTREENYPTVNMEAVACGTPVLTYATGGSTEMLDDTCGVSVPTGDVDALRAQILRIAEERPFTSEACVQKAQSYAQTDRFCEYTALYKEIVHDTVTSD